MKTFLLLLVTLFALSSCTTHQGGTYQNSVVLNQPNYEYIKKVSVDGKLVYIMGFGGNKKTHLMDKMKENMYVMAELLDNQDIANVVVSKNIKVFPFVVVYKIRFTGDVIEWTAGGLNKTRNEVIKQTVFIGEESDMSTEDKIAKIKEYRSCENGEIILYQDIFNVHVNDVVYYRSDKEYGIVQEVKEKGAVVEFYNANGALWNRSVIKIEYLSKLECN